MSENPKLIHAKDYRPFTHDVGFVELSFDLFETKTLVESRMSLVAKSAESSLRLDGVELKLIKVEVDGQRLDESRYQLKEESLTLFGLPDRFELKITTEIYPQDNSSLEGLYQSGKLFCTQCEAEGFRKITYFPDRPDVMTLFSTKITADKTKYPVLLSNGNLVDQGDLEDNRHWTLWSDPFKKPCYLFALVAGDLSVLSGQFTTASGRDILLEVYSDPENAHKTDHALACLKESMAWDERVYGLEYDLDRFMIVAVNDFNMGAMENKGLNIFNASCALADPSTATDAEFESILGIIGHEYFHNWSGNRVTCQDWFQLSLKEGFTIFRDQQFSAELTSAGSKRIEEVKLLLTHQFAEDGGPMAHPVRPESYIEINNFYTLTVYHKGSELIRMMYLMLGEKAFYEGVKVYFKKFDGHAAQVEDFVASLEAGSGADLTQFRRWYTQAGTPTLKVDTEFAAGKLNINLTQTHQPSPNQPEKSPVPIPVLMKGFSRTGEVLIPEQVLVLGKATDSFVFEGLDEQPVLSLLRGFSAPVKLEFEQTQADQLFLVAHDDDPYNSFEAAQNLLGKWILDTAKTQTMAPQEALVAGIGVLLDQSAKDAAWAALAVALPSEAYLRQQEPGLDIEALHQARKQVKQALGLGLEEKWLAQFEGNQQAAYQFNQQAVSQRSLRNISLDYLCCTEKPAHLELCQRQFDQADNMTDRLTALAIFCNLPGEQKIKALQAFFDKHQADKMVLNKYFALQARSPEFSLKQIAALLDHPSFDRKNPNNIRSVVGSFAQANLLRFHAKDGSGYAFLADQVLWLDKQNPQVAARMLLPLSHYRQFAPGLQDLAKAQIARVQQAETLSPDVFEIATKSLG